MNLNLVDVEYHMPNHDLTLGMYVNIDKKPATIEDVEKGHLGMVVKVIDEHNVVIRKSVHDFLKK